MRLTLCIALWDIPCRVLSCKLQILANVISHLRILDMHYYESCERWFTSYLYITIYHPGRETQNRWDYICLYLVFYVHEYWRRKSVHVTQRWDTFTHTRFTNWDYTHTKWQQCLLSYRFKTQFNTNNCCQLKKKAVKKIKH